MLLLFLRMVKHILGVMDCMVSLELVGIQIRADQQKCLLTLQLLQLLVESSIQYFLPQMAPFIVAGVIEMEP
jgi:hypothetical protein